MARATSSRNSTGATMTDAQRAAMIRTMEELSFRGSKEEGLVMRIAKAGGVTEITKHIARMRIYGKKMGLVRAGGPARTAAPARGASKKKSSSRRRAPSQDKLPGVGEGSEG